MVISRAIIKYGKDAFEMIELGEYSSQEELNRAESLWIILLDSTNRDKGYNLAAGGNGWGRRSQAQRISASELRRGRKATEAQMKGLRIGWELGFKPTGPLSTEHKEKISLALRGRVPPPEFGRKVSAGKKGKPMHPNALANLRKGPGSADHQVLCAAQKLRREKERQEKT